MVKDLELNEFEEIIETQSDNIYSKDCTDGLLENDEISAEEEAFMNGFDDAYEKKEGAEEEE